MKVSARLLESVDRNYHHQGQNKEEGLQKVKDLISEELNLDTHQFEMDVRGELIDAKIHAIQARISEQVIKAECQKLSLEVR